MTREERLELIKSSMDKARHNGITITAGGWGVFYEESWRTEGFTCCGLGAVLLDKQPPMGLHYGLAVAHVLEASELWAAGFISGFDGDDPGSTRWALASDDERQGYEDGKLMAAYAFQNR